MECHMCRKEFATGYPTSHLAIQHEICYTHLMTDKEKAEEVCTPVPSKPTVWTDVHYPETGKRIFPVPGFPRGQSGKDTSLS